MSKIKTNPRCIKDCIVAVKNSDLYDNKKETIIQVLKQYQQDKQDGVYTDGMIVEKLKECCRVEDIDVIVDILTDIIENIEQRKYF